MATTESPPSLLRSGIRQYRLFPLGRNCHRSFVSPYSRSYQLLAAHEIEARSLRRNGDSFGHDQYASWFKSLQRACQGSRGGMAAAAQVLSEGTENALAPSGHFADP